MAIDLKAPIDITAVMTAVKKHKDLLTAVDKLDAMEVLQFFTPMPGITDSIELGKVEGGSISSKYMGVFLGDKTLGTIVPRTLKVRPVVAEMADEPERYRRSYIAEVPGEQRAQHPFELWIIQHGISLASADLHEAIFVAKYSASADDKAITDSFDGLGTIIEADKASGLIAVEKGNLYATGDITRANCGQKLLDMWRSRPKTFRRKDSIMIIPDEMGDLYDDWLADESTILLKDESAGAEYLRNTKGKCRLVRVACMPDSSKMVILTTKANVVYGFDKMSDLKSMKPFASGNPYLFTATMKYVIGFQFISIHESEFCVNDQPMVPNGTLTVNITPAAAVTAGAMWRISGETEWRASGTSASVAPGTVTLEYKATAGYTAPTELTATVVSTETTTVSGVYVAS